MSRYAKFIVAAVAAACAALTAALTDDVVTASEWLLVLTSAAGAVGVLIVPNKPPAGQHADPSMSEQG